MQTGNDRAAILSLSPQGESGTKRVYRLLAEIETQKAAGVSYSMMAEALGLEPARFRVYFFRAKKKRAFNSVGGNTRATSSASITSPAAIKPVVEPDLTTPEDCCAAQASRFNPMNDDFPKIFESKSSAAFVNADLPHIKKKDK